MDPRHAGDGNETMDFPPEVQLVYGADALTRLHARAVVWFKRNGWQTRERDEAIGEKVYQEWLVATNPQWVATRERSHELLVDMLVSAFNGLLDDEALEAVMMLLSLALAIRARREGKVTRHHA